MGTSKRSLYRTAVVARQTFTENAEFDLAPGQVVGVKYIGARHNKMWRTVRHYFAVTGTDGKQYGATDETILTGFVL